MFCALNRMLRRQRRRLAVLVVVLGLAGAVVVAHSAMEHGDMGDAMVVCLAVVETAVAAAGAALVLSALMRCPRWPDPVPLEPEPRLIPAPAGVRSRAGPPLLQVFRL